MDKKPEIPADRKKALTDLQQEIAKQRTALKEHGKNLQQSLASKSRLEQSVKRLRSSSGNTAEIETQLTRLEEVNAGIDSVKKLIAGTEVSLGDLIGKINVEIDPRQQVGAMDDHYPVLLLPVKVETRFMVVKHIARLTREKLPVKTAQFTVSNGRRSEQPVQYGVKELYPAYTIIPVIDDLHELWIRIFPDDIAVHTHEEALTEVEIGAGQKFWTNMWYAGKDATLEEGAWRGLVAGRTPDRAAWIGRRTLPLNAASAPAAPVDPVAPLPVPPQFPATAQKASSWSQMPHSRVMPDRFVVRLYTGNNYREVVGKRVPDPLPVSLDPTDAGTGIDNTNGKLVLPPNLRWVQDFDEAEKVGMAIRVPLSLTEKTSGFDKLLVLGIKASADRTEAQALVEDMFDNHHYTPGGLSVIPQGTPTNNTDDSLSGYTVQDAGDEERFRLEFGPAQFSAVTDDREKKDGQRLAEALGIAHGKMDHVRNAGLKDIGEAMCMNEALWPATLGYYLSQMMYPVFSRQEITQTKQHFRQFVLGRGRVPAIRVDDQPYGILPTTAFSRLTYASGSQQTQYLRNLRENVLIKMESTWNSLAQQVKHAGAAFTATTTDKAFLEILGLHPSSVEYYQRYVTGPYFLWNLFAYNLSIQKKPVTGSMTYATIFDFTTLFRDLRYFFGSAPRVFDFVYGVKEKYLDGQVIDPFPFSETRTLNSIGSQGENYIDWLHRSDYATISREDFTNIGAEGAVPPNSLLYLMLRHSCLLEYVRTGINILAGKGILSPETWLDLELSNIQMDKSAPGEIGRLVKTKIEFREGAALDKQLQQQVDDAFIKRAADGELSGLSFRDVETARTGYYNELKKAAMPDYNRKVESLVESELKTILYTASKTGVLANKYDFIGNAPNLSQFIDLGIRTPIVNTDLVEMAEVRNALNCLRTLPTARLERLFSEHVDLASYRLDAWFFSLAAERLQQLRSTPASQTGTYLGAYSWLENVKPGSFPGLTYREVDIEPDRFVIPGVQEVTIRGFEFPVKIAAGPVKPFIEPLTKPPVPPRSIQPDTGHDDAAAADAKAYRMTFSRGEQAEKAPLIESGGIKIILDTVKEQLTVHFPDLIDISVLVNPVPAYTYLGRADTGNITYDSITNKFISSPRTDPGNHGYIHAPSVNHATTAALLRAGYETHKINPGSHDDAFAVNLTSQRVRRAMSYMEGIRNGQELTALLGYQFERGLHDLNQNLDQYIRDIRLKYPFVAARVTSSTGATDINEAEAYNVVDGLKLMEAFRDNPLHWSDGIVFTPATDRNKIIPQIEKLIDSMDAIHDVLMAESVHQIVQGNSARSNAAFNAISGTAVPPDPQVIQTPREFQTVTHRVGVVFDPSPGGHAMWTVSGTARSVAEPKLNRWLAEQLPAKDAIAVNCSFTSNADGRVTNLTITAGELAIEPADLVYLMNISLEDDVESELYMLISYHIRSQVAQTDDISIRIRHADRLGLDPGDITLTELKPLTTTLHNLIQDGKILDAKDFLTGTGAVPEIAANPTAGLQTANLLSRLQSAAGLTMTNGQRGLSGLLLDLTQAVNDLAPNVPSFPGTFDPAQYQRLRAAMVRTSYFGIAQSIPVTAATYEFERSKELLAKARQTLVELSRRNQLAAQLLGSVSLQTSEALKLNVLMQAGEAIFGRGFRLYPDFTFYTPASVTAATSYTGYLATAGEHAVSEWIQGLSPVRRRMHNLQQLLLVSGALLNREAVPPLSVIQFPLAPLDAAGNVQARWTGMKLPAGYVIPPDNLSLVFSYPPAFNVNAAQSGMIVDEWVEEIPGMKAQTGLAVHYNNPNSETPNVCLLAVSPDLTGSWSWDDLMDTLNETLHWAKKRAVDPDLLNDSVYAQILPGIMAAVSGTHDTPTLDFGRNSIPNPRSGFLDLIMLDDYRVIDRFWMNS